MSKKIISFLSTVAIAFSVIAPTATFPLVAGANNNNHGGDKKNICHATSSQNNPWEAISIDASTWSSHQNHGDFIYTGPVYINGANAGKPTNDGKNWCKNNIPTAVLTVIKTVVNDNGGTKVASDFTLTVATSSSYSFSGNSSGTTINLPVNSSGSVTYSVTEASYPGYTTSFSSNCSNVTVSSGQTKTCTVTNNDIAPKLVVKKIVNGGTKQVSDFVLSVDSTVVTSGSTTTLNAGIHIVSEVNLANYTGVIGGDCASNGSINLNSGDVKTCTVTNTYVPPTPTTANLVATKVVCDSETDLPNWGARTATLPISGNTASDFVTASNGKCHLEPGWSFQWAPKTGESNPGDNIATAPIPWTSFGVTDINGKASTTVDLSTIGGSYFWVREILKDGYIPFTGQNTTQDVSAEFYCETDALNYDNYDRVDNPVAGNTYYCAAFNALKAKPEVTNTCPLPSTTAFESTDTTNETILISSNEEEPILQAILSANYPGTNANSDQKQYQEWNSSISQQISVTPKFLSDNAGYVGIFGYYKNGDLNTFVPLFRTDNVTGTTSDDALEIADTGDVFTVTATGASKIGFALKAWDGSVYHMAATQNSLSEGGFDRAIVYNPSSDKYAIAFEDAGDWDYNDLVVEVSLSCSTVVPEIPQACSVYSDVNTKVIDIKVGENASMTVDQNAVLVDLSNPIIGQYWTATSTITSPATWIWSEEPVTDWTVNKFVTFKKTFTVGSVGTSAVLQVASDNSYDIYLESTSTAPIATDVTGATFGSPNTVNIPSLSVGQHTLLFVVKNWAQTDPPNRENNPAGLLFKLTLHNSTCDNTNTGGGNTIPVITRIGDAEVTVYLGSTYTDAGATANDAEDGDLTSSIQKNGLPVPNILGSHTVTYDVQDSKHAMAVTVTRTVHVVPVIISEDTTPTVDLSSNVGSVESGNPVVLSWTSINATSCSIDQGVGSVALSGTTTVNPTTTIAYTITCVDGDSDSSTDSVTIGVTGGPLVVPPNNPPNNPSSGSNPSFTTRSRGGGGIGGDPGQVLGASTSCGIYLNEYIKLGQKNNPEEVSKLQSFLNEWMGANLPVSGIYGQDTFKALESFQLKYSEEILKPWIEVGLHTSLGIPTGYVYRTTQRMINNLMCPELELPLPNLSNETR